MKKIFPTLMIIISCLTFEVSAALSPLYESIAEYKVLINDPRLSKHLESGEEIIEIDRENNTFVVRTQERQIYVMIIYEPQSMPGPAKFHLKFQEPLLNATD